MRLHIFLHRVLQYSRYWAIPRDVRDILKNIFLYKYPKNGLISSSSISRESFHCVLSGQCIAFNKNDEWLKILGRIVPFVRDTTRNRPLLKICLCKTSLLSKHSKQEFNVGRCCQTNLITGRSVPEAGIEHRGHHLAAQRCYHWANQPPVVHGRLMTRTMSTVTLSDIRA